jgi:hypothetical protein
MQSANRFNFTDAWTDRLSGQGDSAHVPKGGSSSTEITVDPVAPVIESVAVRV